MKSLFHKLNFLFSFFVFSGDAQKPIPLWFHTLSVEEGLSEQTNQFVFHDSEGFVWVGSVSGLNRFDGKEVKQYRTIPGDSTALYGENIQSTFYEDGRKDLLKNKISYSGIGRILGVNRLTVKSFVENRNLQTLPSSQS